LRKALCGARWLRKALCAARWLRKALRRPVVEEGALRLSRNQSPSRALVGRSARFGGMGDFDDLIAANKEFAEHFQLGGFDGVAHAGVALVTCMDSRIDPLGMLGLEPGDAKIFRNPGGRVTEAAMEALVLGVHLLGVKRILVVPHTRCAMASNTEQELQVRVGESAGQDVSWHRFHAIDDQISSLQEDVIRVRTHPLIPESIKVGGFMYDVDTGLVEQKF
jgi:carbonic anhydrase